MVAINQSAPWSGRSALENASEKTAEMVDTEIRKWLDAAHLDAKNILSHNRAVVERLANELLARETLTGDEIREIISGKKVATKRKSVATKTKKRITKK